jgi:CO/xanthine dehydrogenase Mo-binding subunit
VATAAQETVMAELTLESLARRIEALENALATNGPSRSPKDWRKVVGMFHDSDFMHAVDEECRHMRDLEREAARREESPE